MRKGTGELEYSSTGRQVNSRPDNLMCFRGKWTSLGVIGWDWVEL
jgi:hypothetical protein